MTVSNAGLSMFFLADDNLIVQALGEAPMTASGLLVGPADPTGDVEMVVWTEPRHGATLGLPRPALSPRRGLVQRVCGDALLSEIRECCADTRQTHQRRRLRRLIDWFPSVTLRVAEVHDVLTNAAPRNIAYMLGQARLAAGRPPQDREHLAILHTMNILIDQGATQRAAATQLAKLERTITIAALCNLHSKDGWFARLQTYGIFIPSASLLPREWGAPQTRTYNIYRPNAKEGPNS